MKPIDQPARDRIETAHDRTLFVDAGAGTGKTTALVDRVVYLVAHGYLSSVRGLAAITFTENAATELRTRVREALEVAERKRDGNEQANCARALRELDDAAITTLHGFAARLLMDAPLEAGLPPGFGIDDGVRASIVRDRWWRGVLDMLLDDPSLAPVWRGAFTLGMKHGDLSPIVAAFDANWDLLEAVSFPTGSLRDIDVESIVGPLRRLRDYCAGRGPADDALTAHVDRVLMPALAEAENEPDSLQVLALFAGLQITSGAGRAPAWSAAALDKKVVVQQLKDAALAVEAALAAYREVLASTLIERMRLAVLHHASERQRTGQLWFHDLLVLAVRLLRSDSDIRQAMHARWPVILVDEFQDTDPLQVDLVHLIAGGSDAGWREQEIDGGRLFFVGDPKQSIYRFRRAEVQLFGAVRDHVGAEPEDGLTLTANFRSRPGVIAAVNAVFAQLLAEDPLVPYVNLHAQRSGVADPGPDVLLLGTSHAASMSVIRETEAQHIAATLRRARDEQWLVSSRGSEQSDEATYADMAILVPTRTSLSALEDALDRQGVPYRIMSRSLVWESDAVRDLITVLQAIDDPTDTVALVAALRHPMFACSDDDLVAWAVRGGSWRYDAPVPEALIDTAVARAMDALRSYNACRWWLPVNVLLDRLVRERRVVELTAAHQRPRDHWRRVRFVIDQARGFLDSGGSGLTAFLRWASEQIEGDADAIETVAPERDDDAVQILTIHGSKGLEFPIVALTGINVGPRNEAKVLWRPGEPPAVRPRKGFETAGHDAAASSEKVDAAAEELRLLYVGMTRAMDHLVVSVHHKATKGAVSNHAMRLHLLLDALVGAGAVHEPQCSGTTPASSAPARSSAGAASSFADNRETFRAARTTLLATARACLPTTATGLVAEADAAAEAEEPLDATQNESAAEQSDAPLPHPVARSGATLGSAVHRALELVDLDDPSDHELGIAVAAACADLGMPRLATKVDRRVRSALDSDLVRDAAKRRYWKEVPIVAEVSGRIVEGVIDLLVEMPDGLVVVDYKATSATDDKVTHYTPQLQAYARAVAQALSCPVVHATLLFIGEFSTEARDVPAGNRG